MSTAYRCESCAGYHFTADCPVDPPGPGEAPGSTVELGYNMARYVLASPMPFDWQEAGL